MQSKFDQLCQYTNVPRKEKQFRNFTINSLNLKDYGHRTDNQEIVTRMWNYLSRLREDQTTKMKKEQEAAQLKKNMEVKKTKENVDGKEIPNDTTKDKNTSSSIPSKKIKKAIKKVLKKAPKQQLKMKQLQKELLRLLEDTHPNKNDLTFTKKSLKKLMKEQIKLESQFNLDGKVVSLIATSE